MHHARSPRSSVIVRAASAALRVCVALAERLGSGTDDGGVECFRASDGGDACGLCRPLAFAGSKGYWNWYKGGSARSLAIATVGTRACVAAAGDSEGNGGGGGSGGEANDAASGALVFALREDWAAPLLSIPAGF